MAQDINSVSLVARLAADPELRSVGSTSVCQLRIAFNTSRKDRDTGEWEDRGNFMDAKVWGAQGESVARLLAKGRRVGIQGRLEVETWETDQGNKRSKVVVVADRVQFLDPKEEGGGSGGGGSQRAPRSSGSGSQRSTSAVADDEDDDIPF